MQAGGSSLEKMHKIRLWRWGFRAFASTLVVVAAAGCRVDDSDLRRWEATERGPEKLVAVIVHDKYDTDLRVEASMALVRMNPRGGRRVGISMMVEALASLPDAGERKKIVAGMVPKLVAEIVKPAPTIEQQRVSGPDPSIPFKDAAYAVLSRERPAFVTDEGLRQQLSDALSAWVADGFEQRYDNSMQMYGVEQVVKYIGAAAAKRLPELITNEQRKIPELARLIASSGDGPTKGLASERLVAVARYMISPKWVKDVTPTVEQANAESRLKPTEAQFKAQLTLLQDEQLKRLFGAMRQLGGRPVVEFCLGFAADKEQTAERRTLAMAALEGNYDHHNAEDVRRILALAEGEDTPDQVRDLAFRRVGEMPRDKVISHLYRIFRSKRWQARWVAAQYVIRMSTTAQIGEFFSHLPQGSSPMFAMTEALSYGDWIGDPSRMREEGRGARAVLSPYFNSDQAAVRTSALGWFFGHGTKHDVTYLEQFYQDRSPVPRCDSDQVECDWTCYVDKASSSEGGAKAGKEPEKEPKEVKNIGEFVKYCIVPSIKDRDQDPAAAKAKEAEALRGMSKPESDKANAVGGKASGGERKP